MDQWVMGYYPGYDTTSYPIGSIDWSCLTHIAFGPLKVNDDGTLNLDFDDDSGKPGEGEKNARAISKAARDNGVKSLLMLGGAGEGPHLANATSGKDSIKPLATSLLAAVSSLGYDGLDLDWEDDIDTAHLLELTHELRSQRPKVLLTYPGPVLNSNYMTPDPGLVALHPYLDRFSVMSYYPATAATGVDWQSWFSSPLSGSEKPHHAVAIDDTLQQYSTAGVPKSKLMMGIGGYAICYPTNIPGPGKPSNITGPRQDALKGEINGGDNNFPLAKMFAADGPLANPSAVRVWDTVTQQPYLSFPAAAVSFVTCGSRPTQYIPYDDEQSLIAKGQWSRANGYGGAIVWTIQQMRLPGGAVGGRAPDALFQALRTGFLA